MTSTEPQTRTPAAPAAAGPLGSSLKSAHEVFAGLRTRARVGILVEGAAVLGIAAAVFVFVSYGLDRMLELERPFRIAVAAVFGLVALRLAARRIVTPLRTALDDDEMALAIERVEPGLHQGLISAVQFDRDLLQPKSGGAHGESTALMREVVADIEARVGRVQAIRALDARRVLRYVGLLIVGFGAVATWIGMAPAEAALWARRNLLFADQPWPRNTFLQFLDVPADGVIRIAEREDLTLRVDAQGVVPERLELEVRFSSGETADRPMDRVGEREFSARLESVLEDAEVRAVGGDGVTEVLRIQLVPRPRVTDLQVTISWPDYLGREPETFEPSGGGITLVRGSSLGVRARTTKPIAQAALRLGQDQRIPVTVSGADATELHAEFVPEDTVLASLDVVDHDNLGPELPPELAIRVGDDLAPALDYSTDGIGTMITAYARIPGVLRLRDDHGVFAVEGGFRTRDAEAPEAIPNAGDGESVAAPEEQPFEPGPFQWADALEAGRAEQDLTVVLDLLELNPEQDAANANNRVRPGMLLSLRFAATDAQARGATPGVSEAGRGESDVLSLRVVTIETLLEDLRRRQDEQARELERVLDQLILSRSVLAEIVSPTGPDAEKAAEALRQVETLGRRQIALGKKSQTIAERYGRIVSEMENNRLYQEPKVTRQIRERVVDPLAAAAEEDFPTTADATFAFAEAGTEDSREYVVRGYDDLIATVRRVLQQMERAESIAAIAEALRGVIRTERQAEELIEKLRDDAGAGIFGNPDPKPDDGPGKREDK